MTVSIRYMGAKHALAPTVAKIIATLSDGPCLDLFAGMCSVAGALAQHRRPAWCNDVQEYAALVARTIVASPTDAPAPSTAVTALFPLFRQNLSRLKERFGSDLQQEATALQGDDYRRLARIEERWKHAGNSTSIAEEVRRLRRRPTRPYRLVTLNFAHGYFGVRQAIEIDSLRYAIDRSSLSNHDREWALLALLQACSKVAAAPGHFAQFLRTHDHVTFVRIRAARRRIVWEQFLTELERIRPYGTRRWRSTNRVFCSDALATASELRHDKERPSVVYADPPYSKDQYSRYYHVLETIVQYDYPSATGRGRYRDDRFQTPFSLVTGVRDAFRRITSGVAEAGASLVVSYPSTGLLLKAGTSVDAILREFYRDVSIHQIPYRHSTLGAAHGSQKADVHELIYSAARPR